MTYPGGDDLTARVLRVVLNNLKPGGPTMAKTQQELDRERDARQAQIDADARNTGTRSGRDEYTGRRVEEGMPQGGAVETPAKRYDPRDRPRVPEDEAGRTGQPSTVRTPNDPRNQPSAAETVPIEVTGGRQPEVQRGPDFGSNPPDERRFGPLAAGRVDERKTTPAEAADAIRADMAANPATIMDPAQQHQLRFVTEVCHYLSLEPTPVNCQRVADALHDAGIEGGAPEEFPKWVTYQRDGAWYGVAVDNADEEALIGDGKWNQVRSPSQPVAAPRQDASSKPATGPERRDYETEQQRAAREDYREGETDQQRAMRLERQGVEDERARRERLGREGQPHGA